MSNSSYAPKNTDTAEADFRKSGIATSGENTYIEHFLGERKSSKVLRVIFAPIVLIEGIQFMVSEKAGLFTLSNPQWPSLTTSGSTLKEAISNAAELVQEVKVNYIYEQDSNLTEDGVEFRKFVINSVLR